MKIKVLAIFCVFTSTAFASDVRDYCVNVDQDIQSLYGNLMAEYYVKGESELFHFEDEDYSVKEEKRVVFEKSPYAGVKDTHYALSLTVTFNKKVQVPENADFNVLFDAAKKGGQAKVHFICRDYESGSPVPPPPPSADSEK